MAKQASFHWWKYDNRNGGEPVLRWKSMFSALIWLMPRNTCTPYLATHLENSSYPFPLSSGHSPTFQFLVFFIYGRYRTGQPLLVLQCLQWPGSPKFLIYLLLLFRGKRKTPKFFYMLTQQTLLAGHQKMTFLEVIITGYLDPFFKTFKETSNNWLPCKYGCYPFYQLSVNSLLNRRILFT